MQLLLLYTLYYGVRTLHLWQIRPTSKGLSVRMIMDTQAEVKDVVIPHVDACGMLHVVIKVAMDYDNNMCLHRKWYLHSNIRVILCCSFL